MSSSVPIYKQIKDYLENLIEQNKNNEQYKLPSENQIARKFNSSRIPAQKALDELVEEGYIYRVQGKGTFIRTHTGFVPEKNKSICLFIPIIDDVLNTPIIEGVRSYMVTKDIDLYITLTSGEPKIEEKIVNSALKKHFDGFIIFPAPYYIYNDTLLNLSIRRFPIVFIGRNLPGLNFSSVSCDHYQQAYDATKRLIDKGHEDIGFISENAASSYEYAQRIKGYKDCIYENSAQKLIHLCEIDLFTDINQEVKATITTQEAIKTFLMKNPSLTAIITTNNAMAEICLYCNSNNILIDSLQIMIFDGVSPISGLALKQIIIDQQPFEIGYRAAEQLHKHMSGIEPPKNITIQHKFIE